jgi:hypoxanthine-DNA glycosylase
LTAPISPPLTGLAPVIAPHTRLLVLGSFPSVASLAAGEYYAHPRNHFWSVLSALWSIDLRVLPYPQRLDVVREQGLGIWDVYAKCRREGSLDADIRDARFNDFAWLKTQAPALEAVAHNRRRVGPGDAVHAYPRRGRAPAAVHQPRQRLVEIRAQAHGLARGVRAAWVGTPSTLSMNLRSPFALSLSKCRPRPGRGFDKLSPNGWGAMPIP